MEILDADGAAAVEQDFRRLPTRDDRQVRALLSRLQE
jgi:hypothetical protein